MDVESLGLKIEDTRTADIRHDYKSYVYPDLRPDSGTFVDNKRLQELCIFNGIDSTG